MLAPIGRARAAPDDGDRVERRTAVEQRVEAVAERIATPSSTACPSAARIGLVRQAEQHALGIADHCAASARPKDRAGTFRSRSAARAPRPARTGWRHSATPHSRRRPVDAARRAQDHRHLVPAVGQRVAETMHSTRRIGAVPVVGEEQHARGAERQERVTRHAPRRRRPRPPHCRHPPPRRARAPCPRPRRARRAAGRSPGVPS